MAKIDADKNRAIGTKYGIKGFPTLKFFAADGEVHEYSGGRDAQGFTDYLNAKCGTSRLVDGRLSASAGKIAALDALAAAFVLDHKAKESLVRAVKKDGSVYGKYYGKVVDKMEKLPEYPKIESKRLEKLISKGMELF